MVPLDLVRFGNGTLAPGALKNHIFRNEIVILFQNKTTYNIIYEWLEDHKLSLFSLIFNDFNRNQPFSHYAIFTFSLALSVLYSLKLLLFKISNIRSALLS